MSTDNEAWFSSKSAELCEQYPDRYLLIHNAALIGDYATMQDAMREKMLRGAAFQDATIRHCDGKKKPLNPIDAAIATLPPYWFMLSGVFFFSGVVTAIDYYYAVANEYRVANSDWVIVSIVFFILTLIAVTNGIKWSIKLTTMKRGFLDDPYGFGMKAMGLAVVLIIAVFLVCSFVGIARVFEPSVAGIGAIVVIFYLVRFTIRYIKTKRCLFRRDD